MKKNYEQKQKNGKGKKTVEKIAENQKWVVMQILLLKWVVL